MQARRQERWLEPRRRWRREAPTASAAGKFKRLLPANIPLRTLVRTLPKGGIEETGGDRMKVYRNKRDRIEGWCWVKEVSFGSVGGFLECLAYLKSLT